MAKGRMINRKVCVDTRVADYGDKYGAWGLVFHHRLLAFIDIGQNTMGDPRLLKSAIFPLEDGIKAEDCRNFSVGLAEFGLAEAYLSDGDVYLHFPRFISNQTGIRPEKEKPEYPEFTEDSVIDTETFRTFGGNNTEKVRRKRRESEEKRSEENALSTSTKPEADPCPSFQNWWNQTICSISASIPRCQKLSDTRRRQIKARLADGFDFEAVEAAIRNSKRFLQGGDGKFTVHIDFVLQPSSYAKLIEGNYADLKQPNTNGKPLYEQPKPKTPRPAPMPDGTPVGTLSQCKNWIWYDDGWRERSRT